jgi:IclR family transcriptional regulator, KDG regulon repressor
MPRIGGERSDGVQAVALTLRILEHLAREGGGVRLTDLAAACGTTKSRIFRHLQTLVGLGYVSQSAESERYQVGSTLVALGLAVSGQLDLGTAAMPILRQLRDALGHATVVCRVEEDGMRVLRTVPGTSNIEIGVRPGSLLTFHGAAQGKLALAFGPDSLRQKVFRARLPMLTPYTIVSATALQEEVARIRAQGWAVAPNESLVGLNTLAAPVFDADGMLAGTVGINDSIQFIEPTPSAEQVAQIISAGRRISRELGFRG